MREEHRRIILASTSPRRFELLTAAGFDVEVRRPNVDETLVPGSIEEAAVAVARRKLEAVAGDDDGRLRLAADTVVVLDGRPLGKPSNRADAVRMLSALQGRDHIVITAFCMALTSAQTSRSIARAVMTRVWFRELTRMEIERYVDTGDPFDKAGAYGIQGPGGAFVREIEGSYTNVIGLPVLEVLQAGERLLSGDR